MAKYIILTLILAGSAIGVTLYFMKDIEHGARNTEEPAVKSEQKPIATTPKKIEQIETKPNQTNVKPATNEVKEAPSDTEAKTTEMDLSVKVKELGNKLDLLIKAGLAKSELEKVELNNSQKAFASAEKALIPDLIKKIATDSIQNDILMDVNKFKESKLKEGEKLVELPKVGEDKTLEEGTIITRKDEGTISVKIGDSKEDEYPADNFFLVSDKNGKNSFRIIEDAPKINFNQRLKAYLDTMVLIVGKDKALQILDDERVNHQVDIDNKTRIFEAEKLLY